MDETPSTSETRSMGFAFDVMGYDMFDLASYVPQCTEHLCDKPVYCKRLCRSCYYRKTYVKTKHRICRRSKCKYPVVAPSTICVWCTAKLCGRTAPPPPPRVRASKKRAKKDKINAPKKTPKPIVLKNVSMSVS